MFLQTTREGGSNIEVCVGMVRVSLNERRYSCHPANQLFQNGDRKSEDLREMSALFCRARVVERAPHLPMETGSFKMKKPEREDQSAVCVLFCHARFDERTPLPQSSSKPVFVRRERGRSQEQSGLSFCARETLNERQFPYRPVNQFFQNWRNKDRGSGCNSCFVFAARAI